MPSPPTSFRQHSPATSFSQHSPSTSFSHEKPTPGLPPDHDFPVFNNTYTSYPKWLTALSQIRQDIREPMAEFAGVALFIIFGAGVDCQVSLSANPDVASSQHGNFLSVNFGWAVGVAMAVWVSGGISGGHINPAMTLAFATWRGFPWRKVPGYIFAQVLGGIFGAAVVYGNYVRAIDIFEGGPHIRTRATASLFASYAADYLSGISCFLDEFIGTAILSLVIVAVIDNHNIAPSKGMLPVALFLVVLGLGVSFGMQTSYALNPARDFGPRLLLTFMGYGKQLYVYRNQYWLWCPIIAPLLGAQFGIGFYDIFLKQQDSVDSPNTERPTSEAV